MTSFPRLLFLAVFLTTLTTAVKPDLPPNIHLLKTRGPLDSSACNYALARIPTNQPFFNPNHIGFLSHTVEDQSTTLTIPQVFRSGTCMVSTWPSEPNSPLLDRQVRLGEGHMLRDTDWLKVQDWATHILRWIEEEGVVGGRGWTKLSGIWVTVEIYSTETPTLHATGKSVR